MQQGPKSPYPVHGPALKTNSSSSVAAQGICTWAKLIFDLLKLAILQLPSSSQSQESETSVRTGVGVQESDTRLPAMIQDKRRDR